MSKAVRGIFVSDLQEFKELQEMKGIRKERITRVTFDDDDFNQELIEGDLPRNVTHLTFDWYSVWYLLMICNLPC